ncbi:carotenoid biosynthesis protein [Bradyrhizobium sediminis]|uniref:Carotenoid biosynthesis protein n=1 Tax=Bradyrhizobium sediminis TaxID=2840469 RepID=A0A975NIE6_9BRAD|nr:carotenoid biosynthesis protein [Bradyrhizobium sediminis]QWG15101.1 carotenoid biosynthesis protein [Bradyrhizobium sediminis]
MIEPELAVPALETTKLDGKGRFPKLAIAEWLALAIYLVLVIGFAWNPTPLAQCLAAIGIAGACAHAAFFYGWKDAAALLAICVVTAFTMENLGVTTGIPFGRYHFEVGADLTHVGAVPIIVGPLWFGMGYFSWIIAAALLGGADLRLNRKFEIIALPIVAAFVMAQWDVVMDPPEATISRAWIWHDGGAHFGVPLSNYLGWLLTAWLFYQAFAIYLSRRIVSVPTIGRRRALTLVAILFYLSAGLTHVTPWLIGQSGEVVDATNHIWRVQDLRESAVVTMLFTMFFTSMLTALRLATDNLHTRIDRG